MNVGEVIYRKRKELGLSSVEIAQKVGVSHGTVLRWEQGKIKKIKAEDLAKVAKVLNISPLELFDEPTEQEQQMIFKFRSLPSADRAEVMAIIDYKLNRLEVHHG